MMSNVSAILLMICRLPSAHLTVQRAAAMAALLADSAVKAVTADMYIEALNTSEAMRARDSRYASDMRCNAYAITPSLAQYNSR